MDPRHEKRLKTIQNLFSYSFNLKNNLPYPQDSSTKLIISYLDQIDDLVKKYASKFPLQKIAKIDLAILRLAIYELTIELKQPKKVIINEAVELAKEVGGERSFAFINGILGKVYAK